MKVTISEVSDVRDAVMASGLSLWTEGMGIKVDAPLMPVNLAMQPVAAVAGSTPAPIPPIRAKNAPDTATSTARRTYKKRSAAPASVTVAATEDAPRVTIRSRVLDCVREKPKSAAEVKAELTKAGVISEFTDVGQHFYLAKRDGLVTLDGEGKYKAA